MSGETIDWAARERALDAGLAFLVHEKAEAAARKAVQSRVARTYAAREAARATGPKKRGRGPRICAICGDRNSGQFRHSHFRTERPDWGNRGRMEEADGRNGWQANGVRAMEDGE